MYAMSDEWGAVAAIGHLGWSNKRGGVEFYIPNPANPRVSGRWGPRVGHHGDDGWGRLMADELERLGAGEGSDVLVLAFSRRFGKLDLEPILRAAMEAVRAQEPEKKASAS